MANHMLQHVQLNSSYESEPLRGRIISSSHRKPGRTIKIVSMICIVILFIFCIFGIILCLTIVGIIFGLLLLLGSGVGIQALSSNIVEGTKYVIECPVCHREIKAFKPDKSPELSMKCPSCKKDLIIRGDEVLHFV
jgi:hypothetical protein